MGIKLKYLLGEQGFFFLSLVFLESVSLKEKFNISIHELISLSFKGAHFLIQQS